jgi:hypothetical protein
VIVTGTHASAAKRALLKEGVPAEHVLLWNGAQARRAGTLLPVACGHAGVVFGLGNIAGAGFAIPKALNHELH